jgi:hypothetical protein
VPAARDELPPLSPLGEVVEGFVDLAAWYSKLAGGAAVSVARALDGSARGAGGARGAGSARSTGGTGAPPRSDETGAAAQTSPAAVQPTLTGALARAAALPLLGWAGLVSEVVDAAAVLTGPLHRERPIESDVFHVPGFGETDASDALSTLDGELTAECSTLVNGFGKELVAESVTVVPAAAPLRPGGDFTLEAEGVSAQSVGVFRGTVTVKDGAGRSAAVNVWIVAP